MIVASIGAARVIREGGARLEVRRISIVFKRSVLLLTNWLPELARESDPLPGIQPGPWVPPLRLPAQRAEQAVPVSQSRLPPLSFHLSTHGGQIAGRHGAVAASGCRNPTACSRYPAIRGRSTRSTRSCRFRRTFSRAVRAEPSSSWRAGRGILNYLTQTCNSKLILALQ